LQNILKDKGFFPENVKSTGYLGLITKRATTNFQKSKNIYASGIVNPVTIKALNNEIYLRNQNYIFGTDLPYNSRGEEVKQLQMRLQDLGFMSFSIKTTGLFGPITSGSLKLCQKQNGLKTTGILDGQTRAVLNISAGN